MSGRLAFRLAAVVFALVVLVVAALQAKRPTSSAPVAAPTQAQIARPADPRLARCQALGAAGAQDAECLAAWNAARARFLGVDGKER